MGRIVNARSLAGTYLIGAFANIVCEGSGEIAGGVCRLSRRVSGYL
jgi:hypothetical protein